MVASRICFLVATRRPSGFLLYINDIGVAKQALLRFGPPANEARVLPSPNILARADVIAASLSAQEALATLNDAPSRCLGAALRRARPRLP